MSDATLPVTADLLAKVLAPYKEHCRYLKTASVELPQEGEDHLVRIHGDLSIPFSCYIDDTGHFNSVEFNLCYNQLVYTLMAQCVVSDIIPAFARMTLAEYLARQLPDVLIHDFASKFRRPMHVAEFQGTVSIDEAADRRKFLLLRTHCEFHDEQGGHSLGDISLAIVNRSPASSSSPTHNANETPQRT